jgi:hypothetical protein
MLGEAMLMQAWQKDEFVARSRAIHDGLRIVAGLDGMLRSMKQRREGEKEERGVEDRFHGKVVGCDGSDRSPANGKTESVIDSRIGTVESRDPFCCPHSTAFGFGFR